MRLSQLHVVGLGGLGDLVVPFDDETGVPRPLTVIFGGEGVGKTALLAAIASTRPGHAVAQLSGAFAIADWQLGDDDPERPHPLRVASPNVKIEGERDDLALLRRREQTHFERRAAEGGFVLVAISGARWFSRTATILGAPDRTILRYDVRAAAVFDDATRADLTRETKQVLVYAGIAAALEQETGEAGRFVGIARSLDELLEIVLEGTGVRYAGVDPARLEPTFSLGPRDLDFDELPRSARHRIAIGALALRALAGAYPDRDPREAEGVILLDDLEVQLDLRAQSALPRLLRRALPRAQWIVSTASPAVALGCDAGELLALRRASAGGPVELHAGDTAAMH